MAGKKTSLANTVDARATMAAAESHVEMSITDATACKGVLKELASLLALKRASASTPQETSTLDEGELNRVLGTIQNVLKNAGRVR